MGYNYFTKSEKNKALFVVSLIVVILIAIFFYEGIRLHIRTINQAILEKKKLINSAVNGISFYSFKPYRQRILNLLTTRKNVPKAFYDRNREALYTLTLPLFKALKRENKYLQIMHFHLPDGHSFLRMHIPEKFGDNVKKTRPAIQMVHKEKTPFSCFEIGPAGPFYRIIHPVYYKTSYIGALELGIDVHTFLDSLQDQISDPITTFFLMDKWQKVTKPSRYNFYEFGKYTLNSHNNPLYKKLPPDLDLLLDNQRLTLDDNSYLLHAYPVFHDFQGKPVGGFMVLQDISKELLSKKAFIYRSLIFSCFLFIILIIVLQFTFGRLINKLNKEVEERRYTETQLQASKEEWERTFDAIGDIVTIMNNKFQIIKANQTAYRILNAEPGTLIGKFCHEVFANRSSSCKDCPGINISNIHNSQMDAFEIEHQNIRKHFWVTKSLVPDEKGKFTQIIHIAKDITEKKELEKQLHQAQKMEAIGTLAGGIAHDFNNILSAIFGYNELAMMKSKDNEKITHDLKHIFVAAERAKELVKQILTFSRQTEHEKRPIKISLIVKEALKLLRSTIPATIELKQSINSHGNILADPTQIHQIIMNLTTNAYHSMMETGGILGVALQEITISEKDLITELDIIPGKYIRLEVCDTGCGIDEKIKEKIFEPYFTTKEVGKGTGLGLAVVHGIVTSCHGYINVYSEPDQGTTFHVYLPLVKEESEDYLLQVDEEPIRDGTEGIMFVDDEEALVNMVSEYLTIKGYTVTTFMNGVSAIQDFEKHPDKYDLIITDMTMPHMNGLQLSKNIKIIKPNLPIILCSGYSDIIIKEKALSFGISRSIQKPLQMDKLARILREVLDSKK